jgi:hypothetical protein
MSNDWMGWVGLVSNLLSFSLLLYSTYFKILEDCRYNPHELTDTQKQDEMYKKINIIWANVSPTIADDSS